MSPSFRDSLKRIIERNNRHRANKSGAASFETQHKRAEILFGGFNTLIGPLGCKIASPEQFREYHLKKLGLYWEKRGLKDIPTRISVFRVFANVWLGKTQMIRQSERYVCDPRVVQRCCATTQDKTWTGQNIDVMAKIRQVAAIDPRVAIILELMYSFGLRLKEAMLLRPHLADKGQLLDVTRGTKGGKHRITEKLATVRADVLSAANTFAKTRLSSMIPDGRTFVSYRKHIYRVCNEAGIGRRFGLVPHGLRHEYSNAKYEEITAHKSPIKGGVSGQVDRETDLYARTDIAADLGHCRPRISGAYLGAVLPSTSRKKNEVSVEDPHKHQRAKK